MPCALAVPAIRPKHRPATETHNVSNTSAHLYSPLVAANSDPPFVSVAW